jgi:hypothetical protein
MESAIFRRSSLSTCYIIVLVSTKLGVVSEASFPSPDLAFFSYLGLFAKYCVIIWLNFHLKVSVTNS